jgi:hypothetical protein
MGLLHLPGPNLAETLGSGHAKQYVYFENRDVLAPLFNDAALTSARANPVTGNENGVFDLCYLVDGTYDVELRNHRDELIARQDGVRVNAASQLGLVKGYTQLTELLQDQTLSYHDAHGKQTIPVGQILQVTEGNYAYKIASLDAAGAHLTTDGGIKLFVQAGQQGFDVRSFGATGDGVSDDTAAVQNAINTAALTGQSLYIPRGIYRCTSDLYFCHHANNPDYPTPEGGETLAGGRIIVQGAGVMTRRDYQRGDYVGAVLKFDPGSKAVFSAGVNRSWKKTISDLSFLGENPTIISDPYTASFSTYRNIFVGTAVTAPDVAIMHISDNYVSRFEHIEIIGDPTLSDNRTGWGFWAEPSDTAGGANTYINITAAFVDQAVVFGAPYDATKESPEMTSMANVALNLQGQYANIGIHVMHRCAHTSFVGCWAEWCEDAPFLIDNSARNIEVISSNASLTTGRVGRRGLIVLGNNSGIAGVDRTQAITIRNNNLFCTSGITGVFVHDAAQDVAIENNAFWNAGGGAIGITGNIGGEISLKGNNYFAPGASSEIVSTRRVTSPTGTFSNASYADLSSHALELDFRPAALAVDLDCSTWRRPPREVIFDSLSGDRTLTLPDLLTAGGLEARVRVLKPYAVHAVVLDAQTGGTIRGGQTFSLTAAYSSIDLLHGGNSSSRWDVLQQT